MGGCKLLKGVTSALTSVRGRSNVHISKMTECCFNHLQRDAENSSEGEFIVGCLHTERSEVTWRAAVWQLLA